MDTKRTEEIKNERVGKERGIYSINSMASSMNSDQNFSQAPGKTQAKVNLSITTMVSEFF